MSLTTEQLQVVAHERGHAVVEAVAGSGKTTTMVERAAVLLEKGVEPDRILILMFNKSAQQDFQRRLAKRLGVASVNDDAMPMVMTFHAFGKALCDRLVDEGMLYSATLITEDWQVSKMVRKAVQLANQYSVGEPISEEPETISELLQYIDVAKGALVTPNDSQGLQVLHRDANPRFQIAYGEFEKLRSEAKSRTFSDLISEPSLLFKQSSQARAWAENHYDQIIVDEYQDVNDAQQELLKVIAGDRASVMAVGDEDQCIYTWRGAKPEYMVSGFYRDFRGAKRFTLSRTFRYGHQVALSANSVIANNTVRNNKICISDSARTPNTFVAALPTQSEDTVGFSALHAVKEWVAGGNKLSDTAILFREYAHTIPVEMELLKAKIPYNIVGAEPALKRIEMLAMRGYLDLVAKKLISREPKAAAEFIGAMLSVPSAYLRRDVREKLVGLAGSDGGAANVISAAKGTDEFAATITRVMGDWHVGVAGLTPEMPAHEALGEIFRNMRIHNFYKQNTFSKQKLEEKLAIFQGFRSYARHTGLNVVDFIEHVDGLAKAIGTTKNKADALLLTSAHRAKGLEWKHVVLPSLFEGKFPAISLDPKKPPTVDEIEEERRLFYVAMTRAQVKLTMVVPADRALMDWWKSGQVGSPDYHKKASRFLYEMNFYEATRLARGIEQDALVRSPEFRVTGLADRYLRDMNSEKATQQKAGTELPKRILEIL